MSVSIKFLLRHSPKGKKPVLQGFPNSVKGQGESTQCGQLSVNAEHQLKSKLAWPICTNSTKLK